MNWEATEILLQLVKDQFIVEHNKSKENQSEARLRELRQAAVGLHEQRIFLNVKRLKGTK
jgi:hypothetical protein